MILISACIEGVPPVANVWRQESMLSDLVSLLGFRGKIMETQGCYKGVREDSFVIILEHDCDTDEIINLGLSIIHIAKKYNQETIGGLITDTDRPQMRVLDVNTGESVNRYAILLEDEPKGIDWVKYNDTYWVPGIEIEEHFE